DRGIVTVLNFGIDERQGRRQLAGLSPDERSSYCSAMSEILSWVRNNRGEPSFAKPGQLRVAPGRKWLVYTVPGILEKAVDAPGSESLRELGHLHNIAAAITRQQQLVGGDRYGGKIEHRQRWPQRNTAIDARVDCLHAGKHHRDEQDRKDTGAQPR